MKNFSLKLLREKVSDLLLKNFFLRKIKSLFYRKVLPIFLKTLSALLALILVTLIMLKIFKPVYLDKIYHKSTFYFFHYLNLDNQKFSEIKIIGNKRAKTEDIQKIVDDVSKNFPQQELQKKSSEDYEPLIKKLIVEIKKHSPWVDKIVITRSMPNLISITITEYEPFAIYQDDNKKYVTDKDGNVILLNDIEEFKHLVILSGKGANTNAKSLFNIFAIDPILSRRVYSATWLGGRRWDIRFDNGLLIKLPEEGISEAWQSLIKVYNMQGSIVGLKVIDLRISGKIYLEYQDSLIKEMKNL
ncbi:MAG: FtsQ-type POTRA domain-containing protein [Proteobacteria bacterium]|nr:FtsQ-type POTRA domain-containing protein [Pseudomonadota bacterium]